MSVDLSKDKTPHFAFDMGILVFVAALVLTILGIIIQISAGRNVENINVVQRQIFYAIAAVSVWWFVSFKLNLDFLKNKSFLTVFYFVSLILIVLARFGPLSGGEINGAARWLSLGFFNLQASEPAKITLVLCLSYWISENLNYFNKDTIKLMSPKKELLGGFIKPCLIVGIVPVLLVGITEDLGTAILCATVCGIMLFIAGMRLRYLIFIGISALSLLVVLISFWENRARRLFAVYQLEETKFDECYQVWQAILGFGNGGIFGEGLGEGMQPLKYLPEVHTDFVFAVVGEDWGFLGTSTVWLIFLTLFLYTLGRIWKILNPYYFFIALGSLLFIILQALVNMGVVLALLPTKGMSLPFFSYGGSNLVVMFFFIGLIYNAIRNWEASIMPSQLEINKN